MTFYKYLGYGVTNSEGVAHLDHDADGEPIDHSYTGVGAGEIDVLASLDNPIVDGSIVSETYSVWDYLFYDDGITTPKTANYAIDTWEGGFSFSGLGRNGWISSPGTSPSRDIQSDWTHLEITKLSATRLQIVINDTYTWVGEFPNLANLDILYIGSRDNPSDRNKGGYILFKNIIVSE